MSEGADGNVKGEPTNFKLIRTNTGAVRVSQACDRCRIKKIKCDGLTPCHNCSKISFECKTSDKLTRRAFPKGYTENLEIKLKELEDENNLLKEKYGLKAVDGNSKKKSTSDNMDNKSNHGSMNDDIDTSAINTQPSTGMHTPSRGHHSDNRVTLNNNSTHTTVQINNPIDQIFNLDGKGIIIGNDNLNFESQFNHLLINLNLPFLKITNSHNFLLNDPNSYLYHPSYTMYNQFHNRDLDVIYNPLTANNSQHDDLLGEMVTLTNNQLPIDIYDLFIKLINNFKKIFSLKKELDSYIVQFFLNYNIFIPILDYKQFMELYDAFHTMYPFMFTYDDATINGFNILNNDYHVVNEYLMVVVQIYAMIMMNDPTINLNLLLNHAEPGYLLNKKSTSVIRSLYDFLPYFNVFHVSVTQMQTYLLFLYYSLITNNKEKSLVLSSMINSFIGILGINLNSKNLFFNDLTLTLSQKRTRVKIFWVFKVLLKVFNLKFGFKPSINTTVINPVTIERYFELTPAKLSLLLDEAENDELFKVLLKPSIEFLNLVNIIIPSSFSPNYYQYLKGDSSSNNPQEQQKNRKNHPKQLDWILNDDDGDGNDGNLNYNFTQFATIDRNLTTWRASLKDKEINLIPFQLQMNLPVLSSIKTNNLFHSINNYDIPNEITPQAFESYSNTGLPDIYTASQLIKIQLNFHYLLIRSMNYLNFVIDKELTNNFYLKISDISREVLAYFLLVFSHVGDSRESWESTKAKSKSSAPHNAVMESLGLDVDEDGFVINDFLVKRRKIAPVNYPSQQKKLIHELPRSPFNHILNGLSMTIINFKKSIILQMLYLLICSLKVFKKGGQLSKDTKDILNDSVDLFIRVYINYNSNIRQYSLMNNNGSIGNGVSAAGQIKQSERVQKENKLFNKLINDELKEEILKEPRRSGGGDSDSDESDEEIDEDSEISQIDWDDEDMDEDLKYLKILKFVKYKINNMYSISQFQQRSKTQTQHEQKQKQKQTLNKENVEIGGSRNSESQGISSILSDNSISSSRMFHPPLPLTTMGQGFSGPSPTYTGGLSKMPSLTKFDFLLGEDHFPVESAGSAQLTPHTFPPINKLKEYNSGVNRLEDLELIKKERLAINDLMNLKNQHPAKGAGSPPVAFNGSWSYDEDRKT